MGKLVADVLDDTQDGSVFLSNDANDEHPIECGLRTYRQEHARLR